MPEHIKDLSTPIQFVKGVGPRISEIFGKRGVVSVEDALYFLPNKYIDRRRVKQIAEIQEGEMETVRARIKAMGVVQFKRGRMKIYEVALADSSGIMKAKWFRGWEWSVSKKFKAGDEVIVSGTVTRYGPFKEMHHPEIALAESVDSDSLAFGRIVPVYLEIEGLGQTVLRKIMRNVLDGWGGLVQENLPPAMLGRLGLIPLSEAFERVHFPADNEDVDLLSASASPAHRRIILDEFFYLELGLAMKKQVLRERRGIKFKKGENLRRALLAKVGFELTNAQKRVLSEIDADMCSDKPMNRLLQGDVGSGKTVCALLSALNAVESGYQAAIMAPTEILAEQHYGTISRWIAGVPLKCALLKSGIKAREREVALEGLANGSVNIAIGTHALIEGDVRFRNLGYAVIDEQHRFGVLQRKTLKAKGGEPDVLVMTATPIPRTLSMTLYGDLDVSVIDELPPGRTPIHTKVFRERDRENVYSIIRGEIDKGRQAFVVCPLVEESEKMDLKNATETAEKLKNEVFPDLEVGLLHGRMKADEKDRIMGEFKAGKINILVATTVVEVGIDVPNATLMLVEHAERFGLSQLHQLRGRIGRSTHRSICLLLAEFRQSEDSRRRLGIMEQTNDGFRIAEEDLAIRGPGEFMGTRQSGLPDFRVANVARDTKILGLARDEAFRMVESDPALALPEHQELKKEMIRRWKDRLELATVG